MLLDDAVGINIDAVGVDVDAVGVDVDAVGAIFNGCDKTRVSKVCRKCFLAYNKYSNSYV